MRTLDNARAIARLRARARLRELLAEEARLLASLRRPRRAALRVHYELNQVKKPAGGRDGVH